MCVCASRERKKPGANRGVQGGDLFVLGWAGFIAKSDERIGDAPSVVTYLLRRRMAGPPIAMSASAEGAGISKKKEPSLK